MVENDLFPRFHTAYRPFLSTETVITKIHMDILKAADEGMFSLLILLDLSSAFDLVNHNILINKLYSKFGFKGLVLEWYKSYLNNRCYYITNNSVRTNLFHLRTGVPQGSVIGLLLFNLYSSDLETIAQRHNLSFHQYADDTLLYSSCVPGETEQLQNRLSDCVDEMAAWMEFNSLKLNRSKTEAIWFSSLRKVKKLPTKQIRILDTFISPSESVKSLGVFMDRDLSMNSHISKMLQAGFSALEQIRSIKKCLSYESLRTLAVALILSRIDYCNTLLAGLPEKQLCRFQSLINTTARLITRTRKLDHITPVLKMLHWVKVRDRVVYKILLLIFKCRLRYGLKYISERLIPIFEIPERRKLRSSDSTNLYIPKSKMSSIGKPRFEVECPSLWNGLPEGLRRVRKGKEFAKRLKISFFF